MKKVKYVILKLTFYKKIAIILVNSQGNKGVLFCKSVYFASRNFFEIFKICRKIFSKSGEVLMKIRG